MARKTIVSLAVLGMGIALAWGCTSTSPAAHVATDAAAGPVVDGGCNPPDDAACKIDPPCGCASNQKCDFAGDSGGATCMHAGEGAIGSPCTTGTDCAAGLTCASGVCHPFCPQSEVQSTCPASSGPGLGLCNQVNVNAAAVPQDSYCFFVCTPSPNSCPAGQGCVITTVEGINYSDCQAAGAVAVGGACSTDANCAAGALCYTGDAAGGVCMQPCLAAKDCASLGAQLPIECDTTIGLALDGVLYGFCD